MHEFFFLNQLTSSNSLKIKSITIKQSNRCPQKNFAMFEYFLQNFHVGDFVFLSFYMFALKIDKLSPIPAAVNTCSAENSFIVCLWPPNHPGIVVLHGLGCRLKATTKEDYLKYKKQKAWKNCYKITSRVAVSEFGDIEKVWYTDIE